MKETIKFRQHRVLICDDQAMLRTLLEWAVQSRAPHYEIIQVNDGAEAEKCIEEDDNFDIIFMDVQMPEQDGLTTVERLRQRGLAKATPIVLCTGMSREEAHIMSWQLRTDFYLQKPFDLDEVNKVIDTILEQEREKNQMRSGDKTPETQLANLAK